MSQAAPAVWATGAWVVMLMEEGQSEVGQVGAATARPGEAAL